MIRSSECPRPRIFIVPPYPLSVFARRLFGSRRWRRTVPPGPVSNKKNNLFQNVSHGGSRDGLVPLLPMDPSVKAFQDSDRGEPPNGVRMFLHFTTFSKAKSLFPAPRIAIFFPARLRRAPAHGDPYCRPADSGKSPIIFFLVPPSVFYSFWTEPTDFSYLLFLRLPPQRAESVSKAAGAQETPTGRRPGARPGRPS